MLRCMICSTVTREPLAHLEVHGEPLTMANVWAKFALVGPSRPAKPERIPDTQDEVLF